MGVLDDIIEHKKRELDKIERQVMESYSTPLSWAPSFAEAFRGNELAVIAEIKKKSPSAGELDTGMNVTERALAYQEAGADAVSVLTDEKYFGGSFEDLGAVSEKLCIPTLCKDFIISRLQIDLARQKMASAVLLIAEALSDSLLEDLYNYAQGLGMDCLVEAHEPRQISRVAEFGARVAGINNRNLRTLEENPGHALANAHLMSKNALKLSLSSLKMREEAEKLAAAGFDGVLAGTVLMKAFNIKAAVKSFKGIKKG